MQSEQNFRAQDDSHSGVEEPPHQSNVTARRLHSNGCLDLTLEPMS